MTTAERLIDSIMAESRIPSEKRRHEVLRELRAHVEDFANSGRQEGRGEEEIEHLLVQRFGDAQQIARQFAWVYRRERAALHFGWFLVSTVMVSVVISVVTISIQTAMKLGFGEPLKVAVGSRHTAIMALDILASAAAYLGLLSLGRFFKRPFVVLAAALAALLAVFMAAGLPAQVILFGFLNGALLRGIQVTVRHPVLRFGAALMCFGVLGLAFFHPSSSALVATATNWLIMGLAYQLMARLAAHVDLTLFRSL